MIGMRSFVAPLLRMTRKKVQDDRRMGRHSERSEESHQRSTVTDDRDEILRRSAPQDDKEKGSG